MLLAVIPSRWGGHDSSSQIVDGKGEGSLVGGLVRDRIGRRAPAALRAELL